MALWANTADGWGSDPSKSGNGALGTYLQSSDASAPKSPSLGQAQDPANSMPTTSIARVVQPAASKLAYGSTGGLAPPATALQAYTPTPLVTALTNPMQVPMPAVSRAVSRDPLQAPLVANQLEQARSGPGVDASHQPFANAPVAVKPTSTYGGPSYYSQNLAGDKGPKGPGGQSAQAIYKIDPVSLRPVLVGYNRPTLMGHRAYDGSEIWGMQLVGANGDPVINDSALLKAQQNGQVGALTGNATGNAADDVAGADNQLLSQLQPARDATAVANSTNQANLSAAQSSQSMDYYRQYLATNGTLPPRSRLDNSLGGQDDAVRAAALAEYQSNQASAAAITRGIAPVDTSTQDAANHASLAAVSSRYSTNLLGSNIAAFGRLYASAVPDQAGTNKQLSDEDYAQRFNQNMATFKDAVSKQAELDTNATGTKLQSDITALGDGIATLNQQVSQLGTQAGIAVGGQLNALQKQINEYREKVAQLGANNDFVVKLAKGIIGGVAAVTAIVLAPTTGGASVAAGAAVAAAA